MKQPTDKPQSNPLREGLSTRAVPQPCSVVIFGATGDLTHRKLVPALYNIAAGGELPPAVTVIGFARRDKTDEGFRGELEEAARKYSRQSIRDDLWKGFAQSIFYHRGEFHDLEAYKTLAERLDKFDQERGTRGNRLFYLAVSPDQFESILKNLKAVGLNKARPESWARVVVEKPFGSDLATARELNRVVNNSFSEDQTYRIDHFLGKETAQNILVLRFANAIFEPIWNSRYIDHIQITAAETLGIEGRAGYYETAGSVTRHGAKPSVAAPLSRGDGTADGSSRRQHSRRKGEGRALAAAFQCGGSRSECRARAIQRRRDQRRPRVRLPRGVEG